MVRRTRPGSLLEALSRLRVGREGRREGGEVNREGDNGMTNR